MKFLFGTLSIERMSAMWPSSTSIVKAHHFFWSSGTRLQKSLAGLYRSLIVRMLDQRPDLMDFVISGLISTGPCQPKMRWSRKKLRQAVLEFTHVLTQESTLLLVIDGLDECEDDAENPDDILESLLRLSEVHKAKVCVASRL